MEIPFVFALRGRSFYLALVPAIGLILSLDSIQIKVKFDKLRNMLNLHCKIYFCYVIYGLVGR